MPETVSDFDLLSFACDEYKSNERARETFDGQVRNLAWLLVSVVSAAAIGLRTPALDTAIAQCVAWANWVCVGIISIAGISGITCALIAYASKQYQSPQSFEDTLIWRRVREKDIADAVESENVAAEHSTHEALVTLISQYAHCSKNNEKINNDRFVWISRAKRALLISFFFLAAEYLTVATLIFKDQYYV